MQFPVIVVTDTACPPAHYTQTGPITIHCAAKLNAQCNNYDSFTHYGLIAWKDMYAYLHTDKLQTVGAIILTWYSTGKLAWIIHY